MSTNTAKRLAPFLLVLLGLAFSAADAAAQCTTTPILSGQTLSGSLTAACASAYRGGSYAQRYSFTALAGQTIQFAVHDSLDSYAYLIGPSGTVVAQDDDSGGNFQALINYTATATGTYTVEVTSFSSGTTGPFTVTLTVAGSCAAVGIANGQTLSGQLSSACPSAIRPGSYQQRYSFSATAGQVIRFAVNPGVASPSFDSYAYLINPSGTMVAQDDDSGGYPNALISYTATATGTYTVEVTSYSGGLTGSFIVSLNLGATSCTPSAIASGQTLSGSLTASSCASAYRSGSYASRYTFSASAGQNIRVAITNNAFDAYAYLIGPSGTIVAQDDNSGGGSSPLINFAATVTGTYTVEVTSYSPAATGTFSVALTFPSPCTSVAISSGQTLSGTLASTCPSTLRAGAYQQRYTFSATAGQVIHATVSSSAFDAYAYLLAPDGTTVLAQDNNSAGGTNALLTYTATTTGTYTVEATSNLTGAAGAFSITLSLTGNCAATAISNGQTLSGSLTTASCGSIRRQGSYAQFYTFSATAGQTLRVAQNSAAFNSYVYLVGPSGSVVAQDDDSGGGGLGDSLISNFTAPATGTYTIEATSSATGATGAFTVALTITSNCSTTAIANGQTLSGALSGASCTSVLRSGAYAQRYTFSATTGQTIRLSETSTAFDGYAFLLDPSGTVVAQDDDSGGYPNPLISYTAATSGTYTFEASTYSAGETGAFSVSLTLTGNCTPVAISSGQTLSGALSTASCGSLRRVGNYAQFYTFSASAGQVISFAVNASFDSYAYLVGPSGTLVATDDDSGGNLQALINYTAAASGTYTVEVTSFSPGITGAYTVTLTVTTPVANCSPVAISNGQTLSGTLISGCPSTDRVGRYQSLYTFSATAGQIIRVAMNSGIFDAYAILKGPGNTIVAQDDNSNGGTNALVTYTAAASGTYTIEATSNLSGATGAFTVGLTTTNACGTSAISSGQTLSGTLSSSSCVSPHRSGSYAQLFTFTATAGQTIRLSLTSTAFDGYAFLLDPSGTVVAQDDDSGGYPNPFISYTAATSGTYTFEASTYSAGEIGAFSVSLTLTTAGGNTCTPIAISNGQTLSGSLGTGCTSSRRAGSYAQFYTFSATAGQAIRIAQSSVAFDGYAYLIGPGSTVVAQDDDSGGNANPLINFTATATGNYTIEVTSFGSGATGAYTVSLSLTALCNPVAISSGQTLTGTLTTASCIAPHRSGSYTQLYTFSASAGQVIRAAVSDSFDSYAYLIGPSGNVVTEDDDSGGNLQSLINYTAAASGTYTWEVTTFSGGVTGSFSVTLTITAPAGNNCNLVAISGGQTLSGSLGQGCNSPHRAGSYAQFYTFTASVGQTIRVSQNSTAFDGYAFLLGPSNTVVAQDDDSGGNLNPQINYTAAASGTYTIEATSYGSGATGAYSVSLTLGAASNVCNTATPITSGQTLTGTLSSSSCTSPHAAGRYAQLYSFTATSGQAIRIAVNSTAFDGYAYLTGPSGTLVTQDDNSGGSGNPLINYTAVSGGTYTVEVTSATNNAVGNFSITLTITTPTTNACTPTAIAAGQTLSGSLTSNCLSGQRPGRYAQLYTFSASTGQNIQVAVSSGAFDGYAYLISPGGAVVAEDDDAGGNHNPLITYAAATSGTYTVEVTSYTAGATGAFTITLGLGTTTGATNCTPIPLASGQTLVGVLASSCRSTHRIGAYAQFYSFSVTAGQTIRAVMSSTAFDAFAFLLGPSNSVVAVDDDSGGMHNALVTYIATVTGTYTLEATSYVPAATGSFSVSLAVGAASISIASVAPPSVSLIAGGGWQSLTVMLNRTNYPSAVSLALTGTPAGVAATILQPQAGNSATITLRANAGTPSAANQTITVTAGGAGVTSATATFTLSITAPNCTTTAITDGTIVSDSMNQSCPSTHRVGSYANLYSFTGNPGDTIQATVRSATFDSFVYLLGPAGNTLTLDDDSDGGTNSLLRYTIATAGTYTLEVTSFRSSETGSFTVVLGVARITEQALIGVEWVNNYHDAAQNLLFTRADAEGLVNAMTGGTSCTSSNGNPPGDPAANAGVTCLFGNGDDNAQERHWRDTAVAGNPASHGGYDHRFIERVDLAYFSGHGNNEGTSSSNFNGEMFFGTNNDDTVARSRNMRLGSYGKLKWVALSASQALQLQDDRWASAWAGSFAGLHMVLSFRTSTLAVPNLSAISTNATGRVFGEELMIGHTVSSAWLDAGQNWMTALQAVLSSIGGQGVLQRPAVMSSEPDLNSTFTLDNDHFAGRGYVVPGIVRPNIFRIRYIDDNGGVQERGADPQGNQR